MNKLLIVDDDYLVREGISRTIDWYSLGLEVVGIAENGAEGLKIARELKPDLIISDVRMPVMDGLEMAKTLFDEGADLAVIVYSGYKDFEYARRALESNVASFLLKPIENDELIKKVGEVMGKLKARRRQGKVLGQFEKNAPMYTKQLINSYLRGAITPAAANEQFALLNVNLPSCGTVIYCRFQNGAGEDCARQFADAFAEYGAILQIYDNYFVVICTLYDEERAVKRAGKALDGILKSTNRLSIGLSVFNENLPQAFAEAENLSKNVFYSALNTVATKDNAGKKYKKLIRDALTIIENEYADKLSVRGVADRLYTSESHLMHEFKEQTGKTFNSCLTEYRILKAEEMLLGGNMRVGEVAYAVGYNDVKYFGQVFKEATGVTPSEFIQNRLNENKNS